VLIYNSYVAGLQEKAAAAINSAFGTIAGAMVFVFGPAAIGI
jgi:hypothetical protein